MHGYSLGRYKLGWCQGFKKRVGSLEFSLRNQVKHTRAANVGQDGDLAVALL
jgi:hypothetical protein